MDTIPDLRNHNCPNSEQQDRKPRPTSVETSWVSLAWLHPIISQRRDPRRDPRDFQWHAPTSNRSGRRLRGAGDDIEPGATGLPNVLSIARRILENRVEAWIGSPRQGADSRRPRLKRCDRGPATGARLTWILCALRPCLKAERCWASRAGAPSGVSIASTD